MKLFRKTATVIELPVTGNCPVGERTADGHFIGRCDFGLRGTFCPRHGDLDTLLTVNEQGGFSLIKEDLIVPHAERDFGPFAK